MKVIKKGQIRVDVVVMEDKSVQLSIVYSQDNELHCSKQTAQSAEEKEQMIQNLEEAFSRLGRTAATILGVT